MRTHHRNIPFRPPRRVEDSTAGNRELFSRFVRTYLLPYKWSTLLCIFLIGMNACSVYLMSFYARIVVDKILIVTPTVEAAPRGVKQRRRIWASGRKEHQPRRPGEGMGKRMDQGRTVSQRPPGAERWLMVLFFIYVLTQITLNLAARLAQRTRVKVGLKIMGRLREDMHRKVLDLTMSYHTAHSPGRLLSRILSDVGIIQQQMFNLLTTLSRSLGMLIVGGIILLVVEWRMGLIALVVVPLYGAIYSYLRPKITEVMREQRHTNSCLFSFCSQKFDAVKAIQAYGREKQERLSFHRLTSCFLRDALHQQRLSAGLSTTTSIISGLGTATIFLLGAKFVLDGTMTLGKMMFVFGATANLFAPVLELTRAALLYNNLLVVLQRVSDVLDQPLEIVDAPDAVDFPDPLQRGLTLRNVRFSYSSSPEVDPIFRNVNLHVPAGTWLCVMGPSGCGKTSLLYLFTRLYEPNGGEILFDDVPLGNIKMDSLRQRIGFVPQEAQIFSGTVRENICYGRPEAEPQEIMAAATAAEMHDFILTMPVQYETLIGQKGASLSGGQRQRLSLARALLTDPEVLVLDDCTSALDADTEGKIQDTLARILVGKTAVIVSQRVSMAKRCHRICTIEEGVVSEFGTHDELVKSNGFYARLHAQQTE